MDLEQRFNALINRDGPRTQAQLQALRWAGKRFGSREDVDPIVCFDEKGERVANPILGGARLRSMVYLGKPTATMVYDSQPIFDHFRKISDRIVMGAMDRKGEQAPGYFYLVRL